MELHDKLGIQQEKLEKALDNFEERSYKDLTYRHLPDYRTGIEKGTTLINNEAIRGWPKIPRTLNLENGVPSHFNEAQEIHIEEKLNGYNTRIANVSDQVIALTRSGIICPFTTHKANKNLELDGFFEESTDYVLCCEVIGEENPYTPHPYPDVDGLGFRVFDIQTKNNGDSLGIQRRNEICSRHGFDVVNELGSYDTESAAEAAKKHIVELNERNREGIIMKTNQSDKMLKYTTSSSTLGDLEYAFTLFFDYGQPFMFRRLLREAFQSVEWEDKEDERRHRAHMIGEAILLSMTNSIEEVRDGGFVGEEHRVRGEPHVIDELISHLDSMGLRIEVMEDYETNGERVVEFVKRVQSTNDKIESYLSGSTVKE